MPLRTIPGTQVQYYLISFDERGVERPEGDGRRLSQTVKTLIADPAAGITDVFFASHGWKGDVPAAIDQYDRWVGEMARSPDHAAAAATRPGFRSIVVGLHWPSLPFGEEDLPKEGGLLSAQGEVSLDEEVDRYASSIADTPAARAAIRTILEAARRGEGREDALSPEVRDAYRQLFAQANAEGDEGDAGDPPGADHAEWNPDGIYREARQAGKDTAAAPGLLGGGVAGTLKEWVTAPLRQLSFWKMKARARHVGETGGHELLNSLQTAAPAARFHLMGHSFGCIVVSATVAGPPDKPGPVRPVDSLFLVQGALSLWSFCAQIPKVAGKAGYFNRILKDGLVRGPIVTTRSKFDHAVGKLYPTAADLGNQFVLGGEFPKYGGVGTFGAQGLHDSAEDLVMSAATQPYDFRPGRVYNLESSGVIKNGGGFSGAHSDIAHPEVAHAMWAAVMTV